MRSEREYKNLQRKDPPLVGSRIDFIIAKYNALGDKSSARNYAANVLHRMMIVDFFVLFRRREVQVWDVDRGNRLIRDHFLIS